mmetsp:Transcript_67273/g.161255  ORF Transcript_67273/g.161255 Transcript_67273/m.161255 type:complete len:404 (+) Transcript_67273:102-1313(+)
MSGWGASGRRQRTHLSRWRAFRLVAAASCACPLLLAGCAQSQGGVETVHGSSSDSGAEVARLGRYPVNWELSRLHCKTSSETSTSASSSPPSLVVGVKTTRFYHGSRAQVQWRSWTHKMHDAVIYATDGAFPEAEPWPASVLVVDDEVDLARESAYVPPWRRGGADSKQVDPYALPSLTLRVAALATAMYECWGNASSWFMIVDDDTFVRPELILAAVASLDAGEMHLLGIPSHSDSFSTASHLARFGPSLHCGGSNIVMSRALLEHVAAYAPICLHGPGRTTLPWYWDEVELLGRCVYETLRLNCSVPPQLPGADAQGLYLMMQSKGESDVNTLSEYVRANLDGAWDRLPIATLHPIGPVDMLRLGSAFSGPERAFGGGVRKHGVASGAAVGRQSPADHSEL